MTATTRPAARTTIRRLIRALPPTPATTWVDAIPFRALLRQLICDTGLPAPVLAVAIGIPPRTARALVSTTHPPRRIRYGDALAILERDYWQLMADAHLPGAAGRVHTALARTCPTIDPAHLARLLDTEQWIAEGLLEGWVTCCERIVIWRALALIDGWTTSEDAQAPAAEAPDDAPELARAA